MVLALLAGLSAAAWGLSLLAESPGDLSPVLTRLQPLRLVVYGEMQKMRPGKT